MELPGRCVETLAREPRFVEALDLARQASAGGRLFVIGGNVYRTLVAIVYGTPSPPGLDHDFALETPRPRDTLTAPPGWALTRTSMGNPRFVRGHDQVDACSLDAMAREAPESLSTMTLEEKLAAYFRHTPLTIQALALELDPPTLYGGLGLAALETKAVQVNNLEECLKYCHRRRHSVREYLKTKAEQLAFTPILPDFSDAATTAFYDRDGPVWETRYCDYWDFPSKHFPKQVALFLTLLPGPKILDVGCGPGRDLAYFQARGLAPLGLEPSHFMVQRCLERGLAATQGDIEGCDLANESVDGVWASASLLHVPKARLPNALARIRELLRPGGVVLIGLTEGIGESVSPREGRYFANYTDDELRPLFECYFSLEDHLRFSAPSSGKTYLNYVGKKA